MSKTKKAVFIFLGTIFTAIGIIGIFIPILPTTPFLIVAAYFYSKSSERFLRWLLTNKLCGSYIDNYRSGRGLPLKQKILTLLLLWLTIGISAIFFVSIWWVRLLLLLIALGVTTHLVCIKTYKPELDNHVIEAQKITEVSESG
jgi:hypothetical protein